METTSITFKAGELDDMTYSLEKRIEALVAESRVSNNKKEARDYMDAANRLGKLVSGIVAQMEPDKRKSKLKASSGSGRKTTIGDFLVWAMGRYDLWYMEGGITRNQSDDGWMFQWRDLPGGISDTDILKSIPSRKYKTS